MSLLVTNVQEFCVHDGPGLRTTVFLKGCPLHCPWCCNPENMSPLPQRYFKQDLCVASGGRCPYGECPFASGADDVARRLASVRDSDVAKCGSGALGTYGKWMETDKLLDLVMSGTPFWGKDGGVTFSGGEPLMQWEALRPVLRMLNKYEVDTWLETSLCAPAEIVSQLGFYVSGVIVDAKLFNEKSAARVLGLDVGMYLKNIEILASEGIRVTLRHPTIKGYTDDAITSEVIADILERHPDFSYEEVVEHDLGGTKRQSIGGPRDWRETRRDRYEAIHQ